MLMLLQLMSLGGVKEFKNLIDGETEYHDSATRLNIMIVPLAGLTLTNYMSAKLKLET